METMRLCLRKLTDTDYFHLKNILQNKNLMLLGWGQTYSDEEVHNWLIKIQEQYRECGHSYYAIEEKATASFVGIAGLLPITIQDHSYTELAYILSPDAQGKGYAVEAATELIRFGFDELGKNSIIAQFVPENTASKKVAKKIGMTFVFSYDRKQQGKMKEHLVYQYQKSS